MVKLDLGFNFQISYYTIFLFWNFLFGKCLDTSGNFLFGQFFRTRHHIQAGLYY